MEWLAAQGICFRPASQDCRGAEKAVRKGPHLSGVSTGCSGQIYRQTVSNSCKKVSLRDAMLAVQKEIDSGKLLIQYGLRFFPATKSIRFNNCCFSCHGHCGNCPAE